MTIRRMVFPLKDKGNKRGVEHFPKIISWFNSDLGNVEEFLLDIDIIGAKSENAEKVIQFSLKKLFPEGDIKLSGITVGRRPLKCLGDHSR